MRRKQKHQTQVPWLSADSDISLVASSLIGAPEEIRRTSPHQVRVSVDRILALAMGFYHVTDVQDTEQARSDRNDLMKVLFEYGKRYVIQKLRDTGNLEAHEQLVLDPKATDTPSLFDPARIDDPTGARYEVDTDPPQGQPYAINITANRDVNIGGDVAGRDKITNK